MERSNTPRGSAIREGLATPAEASSAMPPSPPVDSAADTRTRRIPYGPLGLSALLVVALGALVFTLAGTRGASPRPEDTTSPPLGFTDSLKDMGWQQYKPTGFSLGVPHGHGWIPYPYFKDIPGGGPYLQWVAKGLSSTKHGDAWLYVYKVPVLDAQEVAETYFEQLRLSFLAEPKVVRVSELTEIQLTDGVGYTFTIVSGPYEFGTAAGAPAGVGLLSETYYGILHEGYEYALVFSVPLKHKDEHGFLFDDIARTFEITK